MDNFIKEAIAALETLSTEYNYIKLEEYEELCKKYSSKPFPPGEWVVRNGY